MNVRQPAIARHTLPRDSGGSFGVKQSVLPYVVLMCLDSKKAGGITVSHLRFGKEAIQSPYLCTNADFVACHNYSFVEKYDLLSNVKKGGTFLLASPYTADAIWNHLPDAADERLGGRHDDRVLRRTA